MTRSLPFWMASFCMLCGSMAAWGQESGKLGISKNAKYAVQLNVNQFCETKLGNKLIDAVLQAAQDELGGDDDNPDDMLEKVSATLGFNPLKEIQTLTVIGSSYDAPEKHARLVLQMGKTTGNLEGMMLALPGYRSEEHDKHTVHSADLEGTPVHVAIHTAADGNKLIVASLSVDVVTESLDAIDANSIGTRKIAEKMPANAFAQLHVFAYPPELFDKASKRDPAVNIGKMITSGSVTLSETGRQYTAKVNLVIEDEKRAEQIQQLVQGVRAGLGLLENGLEDADDEFQLMASLLKTSTVEREGNTVTVQIKVPENLVLAFLREVDISL